jgi:hypothetical protein
LTRSEPFHVPVSRERLLACPKTANRFGNPGIKALQGTAIRLLETESKAILELLGDLGPTEIPWEEPDDTLPAYSWITTRQLPAEKLAEDEIVRNRKIRRQLGLAVPPQQQVTWTGIGRVDLVCGSTLLEIKKVVTCTNGPAQIERYLDHLTKRQGLDPVDVRGLLIQKGHGASQELLDRLAGSKFHLELWSLDQNAQGVWNAEQLFGPCPQP